VVGAAGEPAAPFFDLILFGDALPDPSGGLDFFYNLAFFVLGYLGFADEAFAASATRFRRLALGGGVALSLFWVFSTPLRDSLPDPSLARTGLTLLGCLATWLMIVGLLGYGRRYLDRSSPTLLKQREWSIITHLKSGETRMFPRLRSML